MVLKKSLIKMVDYSYPYCVDSLDLDHLGCWPVWDAEAGNGLRRIGDQS